MLTIIHLLTLPLSLTKAGFDESRSVVAIDHVRLVVTILLIVAGCSMAKAIATLFPVRNDLVKDKRAASSDIC
jgi:hypothetical protein